MQHRPRSNPATGHSNSINHAAPTPQRWGRELPLGRSSVLSSFAPPHAWGDPWASWGSP